MTTLRLEPRFGRSIDRALGVVEQVTLVRRRDGIFADAPTGVAELARALAFAGIDAEAADDVPMPSSAVRAKVPGLGRLSSELVIADVIHVRRLSVGEATRHVLQRRLPRFRTPSHHARERCRGLLRGSELLLGWHREAWVEPKRALEVRLRSSLGITVASAPREAGRGLALAFVSEGRIGTWAFG